jgi:acetoin utilization protein AcuB
MFYIYDIEGLRFKGPMEELQNWRRVERKTVVQPLKSGERSALPPGRKGSEALAAYQSILSQENMVEPLVHVHQIMSSPVSTIRLDITLVDAWRMLRAGNVRQLVVTTPQRKVVGLLSDRDVLRRINVVNDEAVVDQELFVSEVIAPEIITTDSFSDIRRVARIMAYYHLDALPVLENENLAGIVTRGDILRGFAENPKLNLWA